MRSCTLGFNIFNTLYRSQRSDNRRSWSILHILWIPLSLKSVRQDTFEWVLNILWRWELLEYIPFDGNVKPCLKMYNALDHNISTWFWRVEFYTFWSFIFNYMSNWVGLQLFPRSYTESLLLIVGSRRALPIWFHQLSSHRDRWLLSKYWFAC